VRVVIAEDSTLLREGLARLLADGGFDVVARCCDANELRDAVRRLTPDVAVVDVRLPPAYSDEGARAALEIRAAHPGVSVLLLSQDVDPSHAIALVGERPGGFGYLLKKRVLEVADFLDALRLVARGGFVIEPEVMARLVGGPRNEGRLGELTRREHEVLGLIAEGLSNRGICDRLFLSGKTVESHVNSIFWKLGLTPAVDTHRRVLAALEFIAS
jgi:DNA-binding NarL/FixJ family response regulator